MGSPHLSRSWGESARRPKLRHDVYRPMQKPTYDVSRAVNNSIRAASYAKPPLESTLGLRWLCPSYRVCASSPVGVDRAKELATLVGIGAARRGWRWRTSQSLEGQAGRKLVIGNQPPPVEALMTSDDVNFDGGVKFFFNLYFCGASGVDFQLALEPDTVAAVGITSSSEGSETGRYRFPSACGVL